MRRLNKMLSRISNDEKIPENIDARVHSILEELPDTETVKYQKGVFSSRNVIRFSVAAAAVFAITITGMNFRVSNTAVSDEENSFRVLAFAAEGEAATADDTDDVLVMTDEGSGRGDESGVYTGMLFGISGENIDSLEVSIDRGEFYRMTRSVISEEDKRQVLQEDDTENQVHQIWGDESATYDDFCERLGSSFSDSYTEGGYYGFYTPQEAVAAIAESDDQQWWHSAIDVFDGATLKVTITYNDGTTDEQSFSLTSGRLKCVGEDNHITSEFIADDDTETPYIYGLLAKRVE